MDDHSLYSFGICHWSNYWRTGDFRKVAVEVMRVDDYEALSVNYESLNDETERLRDVVDQLEEGLRRIRDESPHIENLGGVCPACMAEVALAAVVSGTPPPLRTPLPSERLLDELDPEDEG